MCEDRFWQIRQLVQAWKDNMRDRFMPSWISCLDESMSVWLSMHTCPGWMCLPRKPHPFGNEWNAICCGLSGIVFDVELAEGDNNAPPERLRPPHSDKGPTGGLLLRLTKTIHHTGKAVILDSEFCVLEASIALKKMGVFVTSVIKTRRCWPTHCPGCRCDTKMGPLAVGTVGAIKRAHDNVPCHIFLLRDAEWVSKLFATCGTTTPDVDTLQRCRRSRDGTESRFHHTDFVHNHCACRHAVDDHNNLRQSDLSLEDTWRTQRWENRVFAFILAISEINTFLAFRYFVSTDETKMTVLQFRRKLAKALIFNELVDEDGDCDDVSPLRKRRRQQARGESHVLAPAPPHASAHANGKWLLTCKAKYPQHKCKTCPAKMQSSCSCSLGQSMLLQL